jgi:predicted dithiol-disulfide oxidoreductase (DUF899 family)
MNEILDRDQWQAMHRALLAQEKELTKAQDRMAAKRRQMPWQRVAQTYRFMGPAGPAGLDELFDGRKQLIVYHHMLKPADPSPCPGCCMVGDQIPNIEHLRARDTSLAFVSRAPIREIETFRARMGWAFPWFETLDDFDEDFDARSNGFGLNVFIRDEGEIYRTYFTTGRGVETLGTVWTLLDLTPLGRQESWEESPTHVAQTPPYRWWRLHDEYETAPKAESCCGS